MNFEPLRRLQSKLSVAFIAAAALVLSSCGGGGATSSPNSTGALQLTPGTASIYAGVPYTLNISGGLPPYLVTSSEPTLIELNFTTSDHAFTFVARNPGVVDVGLDPNEVPRRTVNIQVRDSAGTSISNAYNVLQNFFTGYGESYSSTCASTTGTGPAPQACSGADSIVTLIPVSNGALYGNRTFQFDKVRGDYQFVVEDPAAVPQLVNRLTVRTDQNGRAFARLRVTNSAPTQFATYTVTDVATGVTMNAVFLIVQLPSVDTITVLPTDSFTFTGNLATQCGAGSADVFVSGGTPPYSVSGTTGLSLSATTLANSGDRLSFAQPLTAPPCQNASIVIRDSRGASVTVNIEVKVGSGTLPAITPVPNTIASLLCGQTSQVTVVGGLGGYSVTSSHPKITATVIGNTVSITRQTGDGVNVYPGSGSVTVTDGTSAAVITITSTPTTGC
ncbi:MAG: hypothetical protein KIS74_13815 [Burkholderiales bacterium]|nr:hypothetical protein [Burkholderiales bacterium]